MTFACICDGCGRSQDRGDKDDPYPDWWVVKNNIGHTGSFLISTSDSTSTSFHVCSLRCLANLALKENVFEANDANEAPA